jgi:hypothetical protein
MKFLWEGNTGTSFNISKTLRKQYRETAIKKMHDTPAMKYPAAVAGQDRASFLRANSEVLQRGNTNNEHNIRKGIVPAYLMCVAVANYSYRCYK